MYRERLFLQIWREVFGDSEEFLDLYRRTTFSPHRTHLITTPDQRRARSHVQYLPYTLAYGSDHWRAGYISGAATAEIDRGQGLVQQLMQAAHLQMWQEGCLFAFLIPANESLFDFYRRMGYAALYGRRRLAPLSEIPTSHLATIDLYHRWRRWQQMLSQRSGSVMHSLQQWRTLVESLRLEGGGVSVFPSYDSYCYTDSTGKSRQMLAVPHTPDGEMPLDTAFELTIPFAMIRPLHILRLLSWVYRQRLPDFDRIAPYAVAASSRGLVIDLVDDHLPINSGRYLLPYQRGQRVLYQPRQKPFEREILRQKTITPDRLVEALPALRSTLIYGMME